MFQTRPMRYILTIQVLILLALFSISTMSSAGEKNDKKEGDKKEEKKDKDKKQKKDKDKDKKKKKDKDKKKDKKKDKDKKDKDKKKDKNPPPPLAVIITAPPPLKTVEVPTVPGISEFIRKKSDVILLGKALFWDQAAGSDGQACASCHFHAGADNRIKNQLTPGLNRENYPDTTFQKTASGGKGGPNYTLLKNDFPFHQFTDPDKRSSEVIFSSNDIVSSQGTFGSNFVAIPNISELNDVCDQSPDPVFHVNGIGTRKVEPRHTPTVINAAFNFRNFWDGRANNVFNGVDPFGLRNGQVFVFKKGSNSVKWVDLRNSSLASQAVGPPVNNFEMICTGRKFSELGRKLIPRRGLATQKIHKDDSVLGGKKRYKYGSGLKDTYKKLIEKAFNQAYWGDQGDFDGFTQMEANFSLFWGIAIQMYQATLISDNSPYDKFAKDMTSDFDPDDVSSKQKKYLSSAQFRGLKLFLDKGKCINCHSGPEFTGAASNLQAENEEGGLVERMIMGDGGIALYDQGFYNIGVTPTDEDIGVGGRDPFGNPLSFTQQYVNQNFVDPIYVDSCKFEVPFEATDCNFEPSNLMNERVAIRGAFKVPTLRNVELTGPYMHNGSMATLEQVVEFYNRGGNFNNSELDSDIQPLGLSGQEKSDLVAFMKSLTDKRVAEEKKPFDHPQLFVANGHPGDETSVMDSDGNGLADNMLMEIPAVGEKGRKKQNLSTLKPFHVNLN